MQSTTPKLLYVEDDFSSAQILKLYLEKAGYNVVHYDNADDAARALENLVFDLAIFDIMIKNGDGRDLLKVAVTKNIPSLMVTAKVDEIDRLEGFQLGADDYVCKPYSPKELVARVKALLSRSARGHQQKTLCFGDFVLDLEGRKAVLCGTELKLTGVEFSLLSTLASRPSKVFSRGDLIDHVWSGEAITDRAVDTHMANLRKKISKQDSANHYILTRYGQGYQFNETGVSK